MKLLTVGNTKTVKGEAMGYMTFIMHLAPFTLSGYNTCPMASAGCAAACLNTAGRGRFTAIQEARIRKTKWFFEDRQTFMAQLVKDIEAAERKADREGMIPVFRLNGTSDIRWETVPVTIDGVTYPNIFLAFPNRQFYDYTALSNRKVKALNYHLTFSRKEDNDAYVKVAMDNGLNVAIVFEKELPATYLGRPVIDGTETDLRFLDEKGVIVGLLAKGKGKRDTSGFVILQKRAA